MIDTVSMVIYNLDIESSILRLYSNEPFTFIDSITGEIKTIHKFKTEEINRFIYKEHTRSLFIELSIPKFLYGNNITMIDQADIPLFFNKLHEQLKVLFNIKREILPEEWQIKRIDICYNFNVGNENLSNYINQIGIKHVSYMQTIKYNSTILFKNKSSSICFYDKKKELEKHKEMNKSIIEKADGFLRMEIRPSMYEIKKFLGDNRKIPTNLLTNKFFDYIIAKYNINNLLKFPTSNDISYFDILKEKNIKTLEMFLGFIELYQQLGEIVLKEKYKSSTLKNRKKLLEEFQYLEGYKLKSLRIDKKNIPTDDRNIKEMI